MRSLVACSAGLLCAALASIAAADIAPPPGYVEMCAMERMPTEASGRCVVCDTWHSDESPCEEREALRGRTRCCRSSGASVWNEIWCTGACPEAVAPVAEAEAPPSAETPPAEAEDEEDEDANGGSGCAVGVPSRSRSAAVWIPGVLAWIVRRRRGR